MLELSHLTDSHRSVASSWPTTMVPKKMRWTSARPFGLHGAFCSTAASAKVRQGVSPLESSVWCGPALRWSSLPLTLPTWPPSSCSSDRRQSCPASTMHVCATQWKTWLVPRWRDRRWTCTSGDKLSCQICTERWKQTTTAPPSRRFKTLRMGKPVFSQWALYGQLYFSPNSSFSSTFNVRHVCMFVPKKGWIALYSWKQMFQSFPYGSLRTNPT